MESIEPHNHRIFNIAPEPTLYSKCKRYRLKQSKIKDQVDLRDTDSKVDDQGNLGSCAANATVNVYENMLIKYNESNFADLSRLFLYYNTRVIEESVMKDYGVVYLSNVFKSLKTLGICEEEIWPYDISKFAVKPSEESYETALKRRILSYEYIDDIVGVKEILSLGKPVVIAMNVFTNFMTANNNNYTIDIPKEKDIFLGGHAVSLVGYTNENEFIIKNSFGTDWGNGGYAILSFEYFKNHVFDRWHFSIHDQEDSFSNTAVNDFDTLNEIFIAA